MAAAGIEAEVDAVTVIVIVIVAFVATMAVVSDRIQV